MQVQAMKLAIGMIINCVLPSNRMNSRHFVEFSIEQLLWLGGYRRVDSLLNYSPFIDFDALKKHIIKTYIKWIRFRTIFPILKPYLDKTHMYSNKIRKHSATETTVPTVRLAKKYKSMCAYMYIVTNAYNHSSCDKRSFNIHSVIAQCKM